MDNKVRILVVEDEILIADDICDKLTELGYETLEPVSNYTEAIDVLETELIDVAILDIQLSGKKSGIDLAKVIREKYKLPFVFLTSNSDSQTVQEAKKTYPPAFLVKPFSKEELFTSIEIAINNYTRLQGSFYRTDYVLKDAIFFKNKGGFKKIKLDNILYIKSAHVYIEIVLNGIKKTHVVRTSLNDILEKLPSQFLRVHRGYIINSNYLQEIESDAVIVGTVKIPLGTKFRDNLVNKINHL